MVCLDSAAFRMNAHQESNKKGGLAALNSHSIHFSA